MKETKVFLTARWHDLIIITYDIDPEVLLPYLPDGLEPETKNGRAFLSLVAFDFLETKVKGIKFPFHVNFPEINLRFYVKNEKRRGVVFIREFVPKTFIPIIANTLYNENYKAITMSSEVLKNGNVTLHHKIKKTGKYFEIRAEAENAPFTPAPDSEEHFFKEHEWGFGRTKEGETLIYRVEHPVWKVYPLKNYEHNFDFSFIYGKDWDFINDRKPYNVTFARGSSVKVFEGMLMKDFDAEN